MKSLAKKLGIVSKQHGLSGLRGRVKDMEGFGRPKGAFSSLPPSGLTTTYIESSRPRPHAHRPTKFCLAFFLVRVPSSLPPFLPSLSSDSSSFPASLPFPPAPSSPWALISVQRPFIHRSIQRLSVKGAAAAEDRSTQGW